MQKTKPNRWTGKYLVSLKKKEAANTSKPKGSTSPTDKPLLKIEWIVKQAVEVLFKDQFKAEGCLFDIIAYPSGRDIKIFLKVMQLEILDTGIIVDVPNDKVFKGCQQAVQIPFLLLKKYLLLLPLELNDRRQLQAEIKRIESLPQNHYTSIYPSIYL